MAQENKIKLFNKPFLKISSICKVERSLHCKNQERRNPKSFSVSTQVLIDLCPRNIPQNNRIWSCHVQKNLENRHSNLIKKISY